VRWHDGAPFTSADVEFSWRAIMDPHNAVPNRHGYDRIARADTPDPYTVVFRLKEPYAPFVRTVFGEADTTFRVGLKPCGSAATASRSVVGSVHACSAGALGTGAAHVRSTAAASETHARFYHARGCRNGEGRAVRLALARSWRRG
jgi:Bacterial extracellular solute-binding proteins, family 5 Middle